MLLASVFRFDRQHSFTAVGKYLWFQGFKGILLALSDDD